MMNNYQIKHIYVGNELIMYKLFFWNKNSLSIRVNKKDHNIHVYVHHNISQKEIDVFIKNHITRYYHYLQKRKINQKIDTNLNYIYLLNEKYQLKIVPTNRKRKYEIFGKNIYLQCKKTTDKTFLIKQLLLNYSKQFVTPLFHK